MLFHKGGPENTRIETSPIIQTDPLVSVDPSITAGVMQQLGLVNISRLYLIFASKTAIQKKLTEIFKLLQSAEVNLPASELRDLLMHAIDACKCKEESHTRFAFRDLLQFERKINKDSHLED